MILVIDNYDSFTYNLVQYLGELGAGVVVRRNNEVTADEIAAMDPARIVISPGPGRPEQAGVTLDAIRRFGPRKPILGVCLGHQAIGMAFGGTVVRASVPMHGKTSDVRHDERGVFAGIGNPFTAARYHSLIVDRNSLPAELEVSAETEHEGVVMGLRHREYPVHGVQFHPESIMTRQGMRMLENFLAIEVR
ncbi:MAG TPA: aminodeoxychorismate/anthranilate synthase component II [Vicinamibacterales bacterium]|jgi:anthranilate synthase/aminodeoxychorismate synthase-like glutamine amidotransferase